MSILIECPGSGPSNTTCAIVGQAPGEREVALKRPLVGGTGHLLWSALRNEGMHRTEFYVTNVVKRRITNNAGGKPSHEEMALWRDMLHQELSELPNMRYVLVLGEYALNALLGEYGVSHWRGSVIVRDGVSYFITFNPANVVYEPKSEVTFRLDMYKFKLMMNGKYKEHEISYLTYPTYQQACEYLDYFTSSSLPIAYDIETPHRQLACIGLANDANEGICIAFRGNDDNFYTANEEIALWHRLQSFFTDTRNRLIAQNGMFDNMWLWYWNRVRVTRLWFDTMLAHHVLYPTMPHSLEYMVAQYTWHPYYKEERDKWKEEGDLLNHWKYNIKDACLTYAVYESLLRELRDQKLHTFFFNHVMRAHYSLLRAGVGGILIDADAKAKFSTELGALSDDAAGRVQQLARQATGDDDYVVNINSTPQLKDLFFNKLSLVGYGHSTNATNRARMKKHNATSPVCRDLLDAIDEYKKHYKLLSTYSDVGLDSDGRMRCQYKQTGVQAAPGRLSSAGTDWNTGGNLQNIPQAAYHMFIADPDYVFLYYDLSQAEARIVAYVASIDTWQAQFERARLYGNFDCHRALAAEMEGIEYEDVPTYDREPDGTPTIRYIYKRCRHGLSYRMQYDRLAEVTGLPLMRAQRVWAKYHEKTPELKEWWKHTIDRTRRDGYIDNAYGRRLPILTRIADEEALRSIIAFYPQSTCGDHLVRAFYMTERDREWPSCNRVAMNIHDALIALVHKDTIAESAAIMKKYAEEPIIANGKECIIPAEFKASQPDEYGIHRWSSLKTLEVE